MCFEKCQKTSSAAVFLNSQGNYLVWLDALCFNWYFYGRGAVIFSRMERFHIELANLFHTLSTVNSSYILGVGFVFKEEFIYLVVLPLPSPTLKVLHSIAFLLMVLWCPIHSPETFYCRPGWAVAARVRGKTGTHSHSHKWKAFKIPLPCL